MSALSKSKLMAFRQCPKRLWLEIHKPELREYSAAAQTRFQVGYQVGDIARRLYDPEDTGMLLDAQTDGYEPTFARTQELIRGNRPIFEGGFRASGGLAFADVLLPMSKRGQNGWRMVEVKSSASLKDYHREDAAIQTYIVRQAGVPLGGVAVAHIDSAWTYPGDEDYHGLLKEHDLWQEARAQGKEVEGWISAAQAVVSRTTEPAIRTGAHCTSPYECPFIEYCRQQEPQARQPLSVLPDVRARKLKDYIEAHPTGELQDVPDELLNDRQKRVKAVTLSGQSFFDAAGAAAALKGHKLPAYFMDFETIQFAVPIWKGTRPYQQIPFQFSMHKVGARGALSQTGFLDLSGKDPREPFAEALVGACGDAGPVFVYNATFEKTRVRELAEKFPRLAGRLSALNERIVDLHPIARDHYYHPSQQGSWSIKDVLPAACPDLSYDSLDGVQDGGMAMEAFLEALAPQTAPERKAEIERELMAYCRLDTYGMVRLWGFFSGITVAYPP